MEMVQTNIIGDMAEGVRRPMSTGVWSGRRDMYLVMTKHKAHGGDEI